MKVTKNGYEIEGTVEELKELIEGGERTNDDLETVEDEGGDEKDYGIGRIALPTPKKRKGRRGWTDEEEKYAKDNYEHNKVSVQKIADHVGKSYSTTYWHIRYSAKLGEFVKKGPLDKLKAVEFVDKKEVKSKRKQWNVGYAWINRRAEEIRLDEKITKAKAYSKACKEYKKKFENE